MVWNGSGGESGRVGVVARERGSRRQRECAGTIKSRGVKRARLRGRERKHLGVDRVDRVEGMQRRRLRKGWRKGRGQKVRTFAPLSRVLPSSPPHWQLLLASSSTRSSACGMIFEMFCARVQSASVVGAGRAKERHRGWNRSKGSWRPSGRVCGAEGKSAISRGCVRVGVSYRQRRAHV